jgi:hypothetical protein
MKQAVCLCLLFALAFFLLGCTSPPQDGVSQTENNDLGQTSSNLESAEEAKQLLYRIIDQENPSLEDLIRLWEVKQMLGEDFEEEEAAAKEEAEDVVEETIADPDASVRDVLKAWELALMLDLEKKDEYQEEILEKIERLIKRDALNPGTCKEEIAQMADLAFDLALNDLYDWLMQRLDSAPEECGQGSLVVDYTVDYSRTNSLTGQLYGGGKLVMHVNAILSKGDQSPDFKEYPIESGSFDWQYDYWVNDGEEGASCAVRETRKGSGNIVFEPESYPGCPKLQQPVFDKG